MHYYTDDFEIWALKLFMKLSVTCNTHKTYQNVYEQFSGAIV